MTSAERNHQAVGERLARHGTPAEQLRHLVATPVSKASSKSNMLREIAAAGLGDAVDNAPEKPGASMRRELARQGIKT